MRIFSKQPPREPTPLELAKKQILAHQSKLVTTRETLEDAKSVVMYHQQSIISLKELIRSFEEQ